MKTAPTALLQQQQIFAWLALGTGIILLIPLALQLTIGTGVDGQGFNWQLSDFMIMGTMIFGTSTLFVLAARRSSKKHHLVMGIAFLLAFLWLWAELAVGVFTNWGS